MRPVGGMSTAFPISTCQLQQKRVGYGRICRCSETCESICESLYATQFRVPTRPDGTKRDETDGRWHGLRHFRENEPEMLARIASHCRGLTATSRSVRNSLEVVREFDAKKYLRPNLPKNWFILIILEINQIIEKNPYSWPKQILRFKNICMRICKYIFQFYTI